MEERYVLDLDGKTVEKLVFRDIPMNTVDFSTQYVHSTLMNNMFTNIRQYMVSAIVQQMLASNANHWTVNLVPSPDVKTYVDMFEDGLSLGAYTTA